MKLTKYIVAVIALCVSVSSYGFDKSKLEHKIVVGLNLGVTAPTSIPAEIRKIEGWWPQFTPQLGYNIIYNIDEKWSFGTGVMLDNKGMGVRDKVKNIYTEVQLEEKGEYMKGYFTGKNETRVKSSYVTFPVFARYKISEKWHVRAGGYAAYAYSSAFKGDVWDGSLRTPDPTGMEVRIENKGDATFNFGGDIRDFDFGVLLGAERKVNKKFNIYGTLSWGLTPVFNSSFKAMPFKMYNIYFAGGITYNL